MYVLSYVTRPVLNKTSPNWLTSYLSIMGGNKIYLGKIGGWLFLAHSKPFSVVLSSIPKRPLPREPHHWAVSVSLPWFTFAIPDLFPKAVFLCCYKQIKNAWSWEILAPVDTSNLKVTVNKLNEEIKFLMVEIPRQFRQWNVLHISYCTGLPGLLLMPGLKDTLKKNQVFLVSYFNFIFHSKGKSL